MSLRCIKPYRAVYLHQLLEIVPDEVVTDPELIEWLLNDAPDCFEVVEAAQDAEPEPEPEPEPARELDETANRMLDDAPNRAMNSADEPISSGYKKPAAKPAVKPAARRRRTTKA